MFDGFKLYSQKMVFIGFLKDVFQASVEHEVNKLSQMEIEFVPGEIAVSPGMFLEWNGQYYLVQTVTDFKDAKGNYTRIGAEIAATELGGTYFRLLSYTQGQQKKPLRKCLAATALVGLQVMWKLVVRHQ